MDPARQPQKHELTYAHETFPNAPITEAIADFSLTFATAPTFEDLARYGEAAGSRFPTRRERSAYSTAISIKDEEPIFTNTPSKFLAYSSEDGKEVAQVRTNGFSFSRLKPYTRWDDFLKRTEDALSIYAYCFNPLSVQTISLKYINRISAQGGSLVFSEYFKTGIQLGDELPNAVTDAFYRVSLNINGDRAIVMFATDILAQTKEMIPMVLDVEVSRKTEMPVDSEAIRRVLNELRDVKNRIFFNSITDKTKEMFR